MQRAANKLSASRRLAAAICFTIAGALAALLAPNAPDPAAAAKGGGGQPNIVVIISDDQTLSSFREEVMPKTFKLLADDGTTFENFIASDPNCCPSRATFLTGQYAHNTRVFSNNPGYGALKDTKNVLPVWLQEAGYRTALVGKFLNKYGKAVKDESKPAPGWDEWHAALEPRRYYDYDLKENGRTVHYGKDERDYLTRVLTRKAVKVVNKGLRKKDPLFLNFTPYAPHVGPGDTEGRCKGAAVPDPRDYNLFEGEEAPRPPSFNEQDIEDKPTFVRRLPPLTENDDEAIDKQYTCAEAALRGVDRGISKIFKAVKKQGELDNTVFIFWSDNGTQFGEHRLRKKQQPYQESIHVPLVVRPPGGAQGPDRVSAPSANIDLAPTILKYANADPCRSNRDCRVMDGRSLTPLLRGGGGGFPSDRHLVIEFKLQKDRSRRGSTCSFSGLWTPQEVYIEHRRSVVHPETTRECEKKLEYEHYDLRTDPDQLDNEAFVPDATGEGTSEPDQQLQPLLDRLRHCSGIKGRDPKPKRGSYCE